MVRRQIRVDVTGDPGNGKTTLLDYARGYGLQVVPEAARIIIEEEQRRDSDLVPWMNNYEFQKKVLKLQLELEHSYNARILLCDRGVFDAPGFCECAGVPVPDLLSKIHPRRYDLVVIPNPLPRFVNDHVRRETSQQAKQIRGSLIRGYQKNGDEPLFLPVFESKEKRCHEFIGMLERAGVLE